MPDAGALLLLWPRQPPSILGDYQTGHVPGGVNLELNLRVDDLQRECRRRLGVQLKRRLAFREWLRHHCVVND
ncbi:MAG: hypothetical protein Q7R30_07075 [Acidobacteriota bacterium]|nr:hypothetical protein [Acidobacteriota bacterium]